MSNIQIDKYFIPNDAVDYIIDYGSNENGYWRKYKSGLIEQWSYMTDLLNEKIITLPILFSSINYIVLITDVAASIEGINKIGLVAQSRMVDKFTVYCDINSTTNGTDFMWYARGY